MSPEFELEAVVSLGPARNICRKVPRKLNDFLAVAFVRSDPGVTGPSDMITTVPCSGGQRPREG